MREARSTPQVGIAISFLRCNFSHPCHTVSSAPPLANGARYTKPITVEGRGAPSLARAWFGFSNGELIDGKSPGR